MNHCSHKDLPAFHMVAELQSSRNDPQEQWGTMARVIDEDNDIEDEYEKLRRRLARGALNFISGFRFVNFISDFRF